MFYLIGVVIAFFLVAILLTKRQKTQADWILMGWLSAGGIHLTAYFLFIQNLHLQYPVILPISMPLPLFQGPFLFLYTKALTSKQKLKWQQALHFLPILLAYIMFAPFFLLPFDEKVKVIENEGAPYLTESLINIIAVYISGFVYVIISFITILRYKRNMLNQFSNTEKVNYNWLLYLIIWLAVLWIIILFVQYDEVIFGAAVFFIVWLGYFGIKNVQVFSQHKPHAFAGKPDFEMLLADLNNYAGDDAADEQLSADTKYVGSVLSKSAIESIQLALKELMGQNKIYTNPDLTLDDLAEMIKVHPNHLSQVINSVMGKTFYDYINELRVKEFTEQINLPQKQQFTILAIAFDCGFNSKASFYRNFKKFTGLTPSDYMQMHNKLQN